MPKAGSRGLPSDNRSVWNGTTAELQRIRGVPTVAAAFIASGDAAMEAAESKSDAVRKKLPL